MQEHKPAPNELTNCIPMPVAAMLLPACLSLTLTEAMPACRGKTACKLNPVDAASASRKFPISLHLQSI